MGREREKKSCRKSSSFSSLSTGPGVGLHRELKTTKPESNTTQNDIDDDVRRIVFRSFPRQPATRSTRPKSINVKKKKKSRRPVSFCHGKQKPNTTNSAGLGNFTTPLRWDPRQRKKKAIRRNTEALTNTHTLTQRDLLRTPIAHRRQSGAAGWKSKPSGPLLPPSTVNHLPSPNNNDNSSNNNSSNNRAHIRRAPNGRPMGGGWWVVGGGWWVAGGGRGGGGGGLEAYHWQSIAINGPAAAKKNKRKTPRDRRPKRNDQWHRRSESYNIIIINNNNSNNSNNNNDNIEINVLIGWGRQRENSVKKTKKPGKHASTKWKRFGGRGKQNRRKMREREKRRKKKRTKTVKPTVTHSFTVVLRWGRARGGGSVSRPHIRVRIHIRHRTLLFPFDFFFWPQNVRSFPLTRKKKKPFRPEAAHLFASRKRPKNAKSKPISCRNRSLDRPPSLNSIP